MMNRRSISRRIARQGVLLAGTGMTLWVPQAHITAHMGVRIDLTSEKASRTMGGVPGPSTAVQTLVIPDFPSVEIARALSPNGRAHWRERAAWRAVVREAVWAAWVYRQDELRPVHPPARVTYRWIVPDRRARDLDNHGTGVTKSVQDTLVRLKLLPGGDHSTALTSTVEIIYEKGIRRMEIEMRGAYDGS